MTEPATIALAGITYVGVWDKLLGIDGDVAVGSVSFRPNVPLLRADAEGYPVLQETITVELDADGAFSTSLPATDDPTLAQNEWAWLVWIRTSALNKRFACWLPSLGEQPGGWRLTELPTLE